MSSEHELDQKSIKELYWQTITSFRQLLDSYKEHRMLLSSYRTVMDDSKCGPRMSPLTAVVRQTSLDHRLREAISVRYAVKELLTDLKMVLEEGRLIRPR
jgi:hypothetical protein